MPGNILLLILLLVPMSGAVRLKKKIGGGYSRVARLHVGGPALGGTIDEKAEVIVKETFQNQKIEVGIASLGDWYPNFGFEEWIKKIDASLKEISLKEIAKNATRPLHNKFKESPGTPSAVGVALSEAGLPLAKGMMAVIVHVLAMLHDDSMDVTNQAAPALRATERIHTMMLILVDSTGKEIQFDRKDCIASDSVKDAVQAKQVLTIKCVMTVLVSVLNKCAKEYAGGLIAITVAIFKDMVKAHEKIKELREGGSDLGPGYWQLTIAFARLVAFTSIGATLGKNLANTVQSSLKALGENLALSKNETYTRVSKFVTDLFTSTNKARELMANYIRYDAALGKACVDNVARQAFYGKEFVGELDKNIKPEDFLAPEKWWMMVQADADGPDKTTHTRQVLMSFFHLSWTGNGEQMYYWKIIKDRYLKVYEHTNEPKFVDVDGTLDINAPEDPPPGRSNVSVFLATWIQPDVYLTRKEKICKAAQQACANTYYLAWRIDNDGKSIVTLNPPYWSESTAITACCLTSTTQPVCSNT